jgi:hypothetical protein
MSQMRRVALALLLLVAYAACGQLVSAEPPRQLPAIEVYFSPGGGCTDAIVKELAVAKTGVLVHAYSFSSAPIAKASSLFIGEA